ncbi:MAG: DUF805 domain-containing protein [Alphaproteobacteria bacterium]
MTFSQSIQTCLQKYATFSGRASRSELWFFKLLGFLCGIFASIADHILVGKGMGPVYTVVMLGLFLPSLSVEVRRLHDLDKSGWWWWIVLIPIVGIIVLIVWYCTKGTGGDNRFGPDPLANSPA